MHAIAAAMLFALAGYAGTALAAVIVRRTQPLEDAPVSWAQPPDWLLVSGCSLVGASCAAAGASAPHLALGAVACGALAGAWYSDSRCGIVPDVLSLGALACVLAAAGASAQWQFFGAALAPAVPFAAAAALSHGRGMGWGDVKLAALGGAVLGTQLALGALALACIAAAAYAFASGRRHLPVALAPYIAASIAAAMPLALPS